VEDAAPAQSQARRAHSGLLKHPWRTVDGSRVRSDLGDPGRPGRRRAPRRQARSARMVTGAPLSARWVTPVRLEAVGGTGAHPLGGAAIVPPQRPPSPASPASQGTVSVPEASPLTLTDVTWSVPFLARGSSLLTRLSGRSVVDALTRMHDTHRIPSGPLRQANRDPYGSTGPPGRARPARDPSWGEVS
jgi:hypothetical protein